MADTITTEERSLTPSALVTLFTVDLSTIGQNVQFHFYNGTGSLGESVVFQGKTFRPWSIEAEGFDRSTEALPEPTLRVSNHLSLISGTIEATGGDWVGAKVVRQRTYEKFLDGRPTANPNQEYPRDIFYIAQRRSENANHLEFRLRSNLDLRRVKIPLRQVQQNVCTHEYRDSDCGYTGPMMDIDGNPTANPREDVCSYYLKTGCIPRYGQHNVLPFGGCPGARRYT